MEKIKNYYNLIFSIITLLIIIISSYFSTFAVYKIITNIQRSIFDRNGSILFSTSTFFWTIFVFLFLFILALLLSAIVWFSLADRLPFIKNNLIGKLKESPIDDSTIKFFIKFSAVVLLVVLLSLPNYCIITSEKIYFRDIRTGFRENKYDLSDISHVNIISNYDPKRNVNLKYIISIGSFNVNLMNSKYYYDEKAYEMLSNIHSLIKLHNIPLHQSTKDIDYENKEILKKILD